MPLRSPARRGARRAGLAAATLALALRRLAGRPAGAAAAQEPTPRGRPRTAPQGAGATPEAPKTLVVMDNDFAGPGGTDMQALLPLISDPTVGVLGLTVVTGDGWENEEAARLLRFLEIAGRPDIPVVNGATYPLMRTLAEMKLWEQRYGRIPWHGAWGGLGPIDKASPQQPALPHLDEGLPTTPPASGLAASFLIKQVHAHPHQVTVIAAGPLTDIALAIRMDPSFAADAKQLVFMGGLLDTAMQSVTGDADFASDFNLIFDPEAAHIALTAPWPKITAVGDVSNSVTMDRALMDRIAAVKTPLTAYLSKYLNPLPLWDEMAAAVARRPVADHEVDRGLHGRRRVGGRRLRPRPHLAGGAGAEGRRRAARHDRAGHRPGALHRGLREGGAVDAAPEVSGMRSMPLTPAKAGIPTEIEVPLTPAPAGSGPGRGLGPSAITCAGRR